MSDISVHRFNVTHFHVPRVVVPIERGTRHSSIDASMFTQEHQVRHTTVTYIPKYAEIKRIPIGRPNHHTVLRSAFISVAA